MYKRQVATPSETHYEIGKKIITHRFRLDEAEEAFAVAGDKNSKSIKVVFDPSLT